MKKKLLFIPIITLIVSVLSGCNWFKPQEVDPIYIDSWLDSAKTPDKDPNAPEVWYQDEDEKTHSCYDFGLEIRDAIKSKVKNVSPSQVKECKESTKTAIGYKIHASFVVALQTVTPPKNMGSLVPFGGQQWVISASLR